MNHLRVLVIDDSATIRAMVEQIVGREAGCRVIGVASDVPTARRILEEMEPNVITLDINMPDIDGLTFLDELKGKRHAPVVVLSSTTTKGSHGATDVLARGADACFDKARLAMDANAFLRLLNKVVQRRIGHPGLAAPSAQPGVATATHENDETSTDLKH